MELIDEPQQQRDISAYTEILAGLKFDKNLIRRFLREDLMRESVIYQEIRQEVRQEALEDGRLEGESTLVQPGRSKPAATKGVITGVNLE